MVTSSAGRGSVPDPVAPDDVVRHLAAGSDVIVPVANGEPVTLLDAIERHAGGLDGVRVHQMHALHDRPYLAGAFGDQLRHVSYFLSHVTRPHFHAGTIDLVPNNFSEMRDLLREATTDPLVVATASPPDRHGYFSLGSMPTTSRRSSGAPASSWRPTAVCRARSGVTRCMSVRWSAGQRPTIRWSSRSGAAGRSRRDDRRVRRRAGARRGHVADRHRGDPERHPVGAGDHRDLGIHTELISDGVMDLVERGVVTGVAKQLNRTKTVVRSPWGHRRCTTSWTRTRRSSCGRSVTSTIRGSSPPRRTSCRSTRRSRSTCSVSARRRRSTVSITLEWGPGRLRPRGDVLPGWAGVRRAPLDHRRRDLQGRCPAGAGDVVTTLKNTVDKVVTEFGVAQLRGRSIRQRAAAMIAIAHPSHRELLTQDARRLGYL